MKNAIQEVHAVKAAAVPRYEGYSNSATYCAALYIGQEAKIHQNLSMFTNAAGGVDPVNIGSWTTLLRPRWIGSCSRSAANRVGRLAGTCLRTTPLI